MWWKRFLWKPLKVAGISIGSLLILLFILPYLFPNTIAKKVKQWTNQSITSKLDFSDARFSFFNHFPSLTFTLYNTSITGSAPFSNDTLIAGKELSLGINLLSLFSSSIKINQIFLTDANINIQVDSLGRANYNIYRSSGSTSSSSSSSETGLQLENIVIEHSNLTYNDQSVPITIDTRNLNYKGTGDLSKAVFDLTTRLSVDSFNLIYAGENYIKSKPVKAKLVTSINTKSLSLVFDDNKVLLNKLPVRFSGHFDFMDQGYKMDLHLDSYKATLEKIISAIPADMDKWIEDTKVNGDVIFKIHLNGIYDKQSDQMPALTVGLKVHHGFIAYNNSPQPLQNLVVSMDASLPSMNPDSLKIKVDTLSFSVDKGHFEMHSYSVGMKYPYIETRINADLDLAKWTRALGLKPVQLGGLFKMDFNAKGKFEKGQNPESWRPDIIYTSIPSFSLISSVHNGYFKLASLTEPIRKIQFNLNSSCTDGDYRRINLAAKDIHFAALNNEFDGFLSLSNPERPKVDAEIKGNFRLGDIEKFIPIEGLKLGGNMALNIKVNGTYDAEEKLFPVTNATLSVSDGTLLTQYFPDPITKIKVLTEIQNSDGKLAGTVIKISPVSFEFQGQPFMLRADLSDPDNLSYDIVSRGTFNVGKIFRVFGVEGYDLSGFIKADVALKGNQGDALAGRIEKLNNSGTLQMQNIQLRSELFPQPLLIQKGTFRFRQDKMWFEHFESSYGTAKFVVSGYLENVVRYALENGGVLKGKLNLTTGRINLNEFTAFGSPDEDISRAGTDSSGSGVILVPRDLALTFTAKANEADYNGVAIKDFRGEMIVDSGKVKLRQSSFRLVDATFDINAVYEGMSPHSAHFIFTVKADSFSIAHAYQDIPMFREMATSASGVQGIVGMDYTLSGRLDQNMQPVFPSLAGGGVINLKKVKLKGFRLMNAVSRSTERKELNDPSLSGINIKTKIKNNIITLDRTRMRILGFRPRFEGQISLDGTLNIKGRLGLPPFGIIGIPFTVSGTSENPVVKLKRDKSGKVLQEKEDIEDEEEAPSPAEQTAPSKTLSDPVNH